MPYCCVPLCKTIGGHKFPKNEIKCKKWMSAIRRDKWMPSARSVVCDEHFLPEDYVDRNRHGIKPLNRRLKPDAVPSQFDWTMMELSSSKAKQPTPNPASNNRIPEICSEVIVTADQLQVNTDEVYMECSCTNMDMAVQMDKVTQTMNKLNAFSITKFMFDPAAVHYYTGLEHYERFMFVLATLGPAAYNLIYRWRPCNDLSVPNQFFLTLIKLRLHSPNFELSRMFDVSEFSVGNIFVTWVNFMALQWGELNIWPSREAVDYFMPSDFRKKFASTRVIIDGMECPIKKPSFPIAQQATFSNYKNRNTLKVVVGATPGGLLSHISPAFGGSASDRQLVERSALLNKCDKNDSIMADRGFNVQDLFASKDIHINIPTFLTGKNRLPGLAVVKDRKIASKRVHIERLIGLAKTYKILQQPMNSSESVLGSEIIFVCCMLCNFRRCIIPVNA